jgi:hypothetical protein
MATTSGDWWVHNAARAFAERVLRPAHLLEEARRLEAAPTVDDARVRALTLRAAADVLAVPTLSLHAHLRASGAAFVALCGPVAAVRLRLDDLELRDGSTMRTADVATAAVGQLPFGPDLDQAAAAVAGSEFVRIWVDRDQVLPGAVALIRRLPMRAELAGEFASEHAYALLRIARASVAAEVGAGGLAWHIVGPPSLPAQEPIRWYPRLPGAAGEVDVERPWLARTTLSRLANGDVPFAGCRGLIVGFCTAGSSIVDASGVVLARGRVERAIDAVRGAGVQVVAEWILGAPGISEADYELTMTDIRRRPFFDWLAGLRRFELTQGSSWRGVVAGAPPPEEDLARSLPIKEPPTLPRSAVDALLDRAARELQEDRAFVAGAVAGAFLEAPPVRPKPGRLLKLDSDCAIFPSADAPDTVPWCVVDFRTGTTLMLDSRAGRRLAAFREPRELEAVFPRCGPTTERLVQTLLDRRVLIPCL